MPKFEQTTSTGTKIFGVTSRSTHKSMRQNCDLKVQVESTSSEVKIFTKTPIDEFNNCSVAAIPDYVDTAEMVEHDLDVKLQSKLKYLDLLIEDSDDLEYIDYLILVCPVLRDTDDLEAEQLISAYQEEYGFKNPF